MKCKNITPTTIDEAQLIARQMCEYYFTLCRNNFSNATIVVNEVYFPNVPWKYGQITNLSDDSKILINAAQDEIEAYFIVHGIKYTRMTSCWPSKFILYKE